MTKLAALACALVACGPPAVAPPVKAPPVPVAKHVAPVDVVPPTKPPPQVPAGARLPAGVRPVAYDVRLEVDPDRAVFSGTVAITVKLDAPADHVWLHAVDLDLTEGRYRTSTRSGELAIGAAAPDSGGLRAFAFPSELPAGEVRLELAYTGRVGTAAEGLFREETGGRWYLFAQSEAMFARRIVPCFDEPSAKAAWRVTLVVPKGQVALANGALASERPGAQDGTVEATFAEVAAMPSYVFAIAVGPFDVVAGGALGRNRVPLRVAVARGDRAKAATAVAKTGPVVDALERYFDAPLPLDKLDLVAVPHLFGAMENVGLVTFDAAALVGDATNPPFVRRFIRYLAHELAHQWFGNSVTPAWWDDLWLSESLATWLADRISLELAAFDDPTLRTLLARERALAADAEVDARPLRRPIASVDDADVRFDAIAYEKGSAVLAMFERFAGPAAFQTAIRGYVRAHAGGVATAHDFTNAFDPAIGAALLRYAEAAGTPVVEIAARCAAGAPPAVEIRARDGAAVPVCIRTP
ncbi:MAG: hypothetical protein KIT31_30255, partial [Deltaproteobacteria bacterium]|nr:hypothetical protein [Deltaproteobacteria bacterium]